jgi:hypothetical protein
MKIGETNNIKDLAPTLVEHYVDEEVSENIYEEYREKIKNYKTIIGIESKYFFGHLHDSEILSLKIINGNLHFILNDIATLEFASALIDKMELKISAYNMKFPIEIITDETKHLSLNIVDVNGEIFNNKFVKLNEYLNEEIIEWNDKSKEIVFDLWASKKSVNRYLLLVSCKGIKIVENQKTYWRKYFGEEYNKYYNCFTDKRNNGEYLSDYTLCEKLIKEIENV